MTIDFKSFALEIAQREGSESLLPVIEKELIHYDILKALDDSCWLDRLNFQGGTCLRLCYGSIRYSEDLDFTIADDLSDADLKGFKELVSRALEQKYDVSVRVKEPKKIKVFDGGAAMKRWQVVVDTAPARPDLPSQKIKIEIAHVPSYTRELQLLRENYLELQGAFGTIMVGCQSLGEILADKIVSFSQQVLAPRYRDLWDIPWIAAQPGWNMDAVADMVFQKYGDYQTELPAVEALESGADRAREALASPTFRGEMARFLPVSVIERTLDRAGYQEAMASRIAEIYASVSQRAR